MAHRHRRRRQSLQQFHLDMHGQWVVAVVASHAAIPCVVTSIMVPGLACCLVCMASCVGLPADLNIDELAVECCCLRPLMVQPSP